MSIGGGEYSSYCDTDARKAIIDNLRSAGIATVISSGNDSFDGAVGSPGCISSAITVGATLNNSNVVAVYSNHASMVDMMAPGSDIYSSVPVSTTSYESKNGTSMAAPHITGAFAVMKDKFPTWSISEIEFALETTGVDSTRLDITKPRIDLLSATEYMPPTPPPDDDFLLMLMPTVIAAARTPHWGAFTNLCCDTSSLTYGVTQGDQYRSSSISSCVAAASFDGYLGTSAGSKIFSHSVMSDGCGSFWGSYSLTLDAGKRYLWVADLNSSGEPGFVLYSESISGATESISATNLNNGSAPADMDIEASGPLFLKQIGDGQSKYKRLDRLRVSQ